MSTYTRSVFINCPFDEAYSPLLRAIVFTVRDCGFIPRCALEKSDSGEVRIQKIYRIIEECGLSIHDLSRTQVDSNTGLPRFNMPLEFGIFLGAKFLGPQQQQKKVCLVFDEQPYRYHMYLSDVAGQDIKWHANSPRTAMLHVRDWLASMVKMHLPSGSIVWDRYLTFQGELRHNCERLKQRTEELTYSDILRHITGFQSRYKQVADVQGKRKILNPEPWQIKEAVKSIVFSDPNPYIILEKGANGFTYMQAISRSKNSWAVEYQDGHLEQHFIASTPISTDDVIAMFLAFMHGDDRWRTSGHWKPLKI